MGEDVAISTAAKQHPLPPTRAFPSPGHITTFPPEILLHIFSYAVLTCPHSITSHQNSALSLSRVCSAWRTLVVQTGAFWTRITINYRYGIPAGADSAEAVMVWLSRAGRTSSLDITFLVPEERAKKREPAQSSDGSHISEEEEDEAEEMSEDHSNTDEEENEEEEISEDYSSTDGEDPLQVVGRPPGVMFGLPETYDPRVIKTVDVLAPSYKRWRSLACFMPDSLLARLFPFVRRGQFAISADSSSPPFDFPVLETLEISVSHGLSRAWVGRPVLVLQPFTASPALTSVIIPSHASSLRVGELPWSQLRTLHVNSPNHNSVNCSALELNQALVQCTQLEELVLNLQTVQHGANPNALLPVITPRQTLPSLRVMTLGPCARSYVGHMHLMGSIIAPSLEILSLARRKEPERDELYEDVLNILDQSDQVEHDIPQQHRTLCQSVTAFLQASDTRLTTLHLSVFHADAESIWGLFNAAADTLDVVSFRGEHPLVLDGMHYVPTSPFASEIRWAVDPVESARRNDDLAKLVDEEIPKIAFRRVRVSENDNAALLEQ